MEPLYIHFRFENARLISSGYLSPDKAFIESGNLERPVKANQISGFLHALCGLAPVPSKKYTVLKRCEDIQKLVDNTWIRYDRIPTKNEAEFVMTGKYEYNSHVKSKMNIKGIGFVDGYYTWDYLKRSLRKKQELYMDLKEVFENTCKSDFSKVPFRKFIPEFHKHLNDKCVKDFADKYPDEIKKHTLCLLFKIKNSSTNCSYSMTSVGTSLLNANGIGYAFVYSGDIVVRIDDMEIVKMINMCGCVPTILDGGFVKVVWTGNEVPFGDMDKTFERFSSRNCSLTY